MLQTKKPEKLWASGLLKLTIENWEDQPQSMNGEQVLDFIKRNVKEFTKYISSDEAKTSFFLTLYKLCSMRNISKPEFETIMLCFVKRK